MLDLLQALGLPMCIGKQISCLEKQTQHLILERAKCWEENETTVVTGCGPWDLLEEVAFWSWV